MSSSSSLSWSRNRKDKQKKRRRAKGNEARGSVDGKSDRRVTISAGGGGGCEVAEEELHRVPGRLYLNGASEIACLYTQQGKKGTNQDAMLVWEVHLHLHFLCVYKDIELFGAVLIRPRRPIIGKLSADVILVER